MWTNKYLTFLNQIPKYSLVADIGCGNGKNMCHLSNDYIFIGADFSIELAKICNKKNLEICCANNCALPLIIIVLIIV